MTNAKPAEWTSWAGAVRCQPAAIQTPGDEGEVARALLDARAAGRGVRVVGSGHSSMPLVATDGVILSLDRLAGIEACDPSARVATIRAGSKLHDLGEPLRERGLAFENLGDVDVQSLGGALGTGTHGTGRTLGNLASRVCGMRLVTATGDPFECTTERDPEALRAARVSLGALGVVTAATLRLAPAFRLHERVWRGPVEAVLEDLDGLIRGNRHFEFFYFPKHDFAEGKTLNPTESAPDAMPDVKGERVGWSADVIPSVREERFHEMEYAVPAALGMDCFRAARERLRARHPDVTWPIEYRTVAADDTDLSPAHGRETVTISIHQDVAKPHREVFCDLEPIFLEAGGRPHWGKFHTQTAATLRDRYPRWDHFQSLREKLDPSGLFLNDHLRSLFGV